MDNPTRLTIYKAQCENVLELQRAAKQCARTINAALLKGDAPLVRVNTFIYALIYSTWAEVSFSKLIHTPAGFAASEIIQIKRNHRNLDTAWTKCIQLALRKLKGSPGDLQNKRQKIEKLVTTYVIEPSRLRNKIAHGNWIKCLNHDQNAINLQLTGALKGINVVEVQKWFEIYKYVERIIEDIIESPERAHRRDYWKHVTELEEFIELSKQWSVEKRVEQLKQKSSYRT
jgi:hypothetical protein